MEWLRNTHQHLIALDADKVHQLFQHYSNLGPLPGILLPFLEALFPPIPLFAVVAANAIAYGFWLGFFYSLIGSVAGALVVFLISRKFESRFRSYMDRKYPRSERFFFWIQHSGFTPLFILSSLPFVPSFAVNIACGVTNVNFYTFLLSKIMGKIVMILIMAYVGYDWHAFLVQPWRILIAVAVFGLLWYVGKKLERRYQLG